MKSIRGFVIAFEEAVEEQQLEGFVLIKSPQSNTLYWRSPNTSLWTPETVVWLHLNGPTKLILDSVQSRDALGIPLDKWKVIQRAYSDYPGCSESLRDRLLDIAGV